MASTDGQAGEPGSIDKDYIDIVRSDVDIDKAFIKDTGIPAKIFYFCKDCKKMIKPKRVGKKFRFSCTECKGSNVAFGSKESINNYYKIKK